MAIMVIGAAVAFSAVFGARELYDSDSARNDLNQNLRSTMDLIATEVRQAGGHLASDFPAVELVTNVAGDRLTVRRHLLETTLLSCTDLVASATKIYVGLPTGTGNCSIFPDNDTDGYPDNIQEYREYRLANGSGTPVVLPNGYIYDPTTNLGEFFAFEDEQLEIATDRWYLELSGPGLAASYPVANQPRVYLIDESRFDLNAGTIELRRDGDAANALAVVDDVTDFQVALLLQDSSTVNVFTNTDDWSTIQTVQLSLTGQTTLRNRAMTRTLTSDVFPRNILSE